MDQNWFGMGKWWVAIEYSGDICVFGLEFKSCGAFIQRRRRRGSVFGREEF